MIRFIGDIHGKIPEYLAITDNCEKSIQVGDFGAGMVNMPDNTTDHRFIRGNHDSPDVCKNTRYWIKDGTIEGDMMFIGGADSIDKHLRVESRDWWSDEELSISDLNTLYDVYIKNKPKVMVTHECPESVANHFFPWMQTNVHHSRTRQAFNSMFEVHRPDIWIFGHWHTNIDTVVLGTRFICLNELYYIDLDV